MGKGYDMGWGRSNYVAYQDTAVDLSRVGPEEGDRPPPSLELWGTCRSPKNCASQMPLHIVTRRSGSPSAKATEDKLTALPCHGFHLGRATLLGRRNATLSSTRVIAI